MYIFVSFLTKVTMVVNHKVASQTMYLRVIMVSQHMVTGHQLQQRLPIRIIKTAKTWVYKNNILLSFVLHLLLLKTMSPVWLLFFFYGFISFWYMYYAYFICLFSCRLCLYYRIFNLYFSNISLVICFHCSVTILVFFTQLVLELNRRRSTCL